MPREAAGRRTGGFALIAALALLVVLGTTGAAMLRMTAIEQAGSSQRILGLRADRAAASGLEWARHQVARGPGCPAPLSAFSLMEGALAGFRVVVACSESLHDEDGTIRRSVTLRSQASFGALGGPDFAFREQSVTQVF